MERYNFVDLIRRHSVAFEVLSYAEGEYVGGKYQNGAETVSERSGAILPMSDRKIYQSGGTYTTQDRTLYMSTPLEGALETLRVRYKGNVYSVESDQDFEDYSAAYIYDLKWVEQLSNKEASGA